MLCIFSAYGAMTYERFRTLQTQDSMASTHFSPNAETSSVLGYGHFGSTADSTNGITPL